MFANLIQLLLRRDQPREEYDYAFVREVTLQTREPRSRRLERWLTVSWVLIALKSALIWWAFRRYHVPISAAWIVAPTIAMGAYCTWIYLRRR